MRWQFTLAIVAALFLVSAGSIGSVRADDAAGKGAKEEEKGKGGFKGKFEKGKGKGGFGKGKGPGGPGGGAGKAEFMKKFDKDGDGKLSEDEKQAIKDAFAARKKKQE